MKIESVTPQFDASKVPQDALDIIEKFDDILQNVRPLNSRQLQQLPDNIRALSHQLTDERSSRRLGYMNDTVQLISYVRYYTWWNLVRLTRLFSSLPAECFPDGTSGTSCLDLGTGPLTVVTALWLARPELRKLPLTWYCLDVSANSMVLGEDVYLSVVARTGGEPWKIIRVKGSFGTSIKQKASFITCANMFNELDQSSDMPPEFRVKKYYAQLGTYSEKNARFLFIEPGVPKAARTLSLLRERFIKGGSVIAAPCPHSQECPMSGFKAYTGSKNKWCNFAFSTQDAPGRLQKLSERAKLPKERATLSYLAVVPSATPGATGTSAKQTNSLLCRVTSDKIRLPNYMCGYYGCTQYGLSLITMPDENNTKLPKPPFRPKSGDLVSFQAKKIPDSPSAQKRDEKSGALIIEV
jgi:ribosomal protein RSM22 (predicted rRNA methylase)